MKDFQIKGKKYGAEFGLSVIRDFSLNNGYDTMDAFYNWFSGIKWEKLPFAELTKVSELFFGGFKKHADRNKIELDITADDIYDIMVQPVGAEIVSEFTKSITLGNQPVPLKAGPKQKKATL